MKLNEQQKFMLKKLDPLIEQASIAFLEDSEHFSYLVNHVLAKLENMSFTELTYLKDEVNEIVKEDMEC